MYSATLEEIAGDQIANYEKFYQQINPVNSNIIKALDAANFLRKSGLSQPTLKIIWDLSDPNGLGYLDKKSFFVCLKLIAMAQNGKNLEDGINNLKTSFPSPKFIDDSSDSSPWNISLENVQKYTNVFTYLNPIDGKLAGTKVRPYLMSSKLPVENLTKIWDLSDINKDGFLNLKEFIVCCHLIAKSSQGITLPATLPPELLNFNCERTRSLSRTSSVSAGSPNLNLNEGNLNNSQWVVSTEEKTKSDELFTKFDTDNDGFVSGVDVKDALLESGLPQPILAHIWKLCDIKETGNLNSEQFALARFLIKQKQNGLELPIKLLPNMIPPTLRPKPTESMSNENINGSVNQTSSTGNKELDILTEDIKKIQLEKTKYESEVLAEETSLKLKQSELKSIQNEIEALTQMLKQLENQKNDASKRIDDLNGQVDSLNRQYNEQKSSIDNQENDLNLKKKEFENLKEEETILETKLETSKNDLDQISKTAAETQLEISQIKAKFLEIDDYERRFNEMMFDYDNAISNADYAKITSLLPKNLTPPEILSEEFQIIEETFKDEFSSDPFAGEDPFKDDPFGANKANEAFNSDNFANFDAFSSSNNKNDPFGFSPFSGDSSNQASGDAFRTESPTPALPPKKSKAAPPRPAPPKSTNKTPLRAAPPPPSKDKQSTVNAFNSANFDPFSDKNRDPFGSDSFASAENFANFADFDKA